MSRWHREHPELTGTEADPWMIHDDYRRAVEETSRRTPPPTDAQIEQAERASSYQCIHEECGRVQGAGDTCIECGGQIEPREP